MKATIQSSLPLSTPFLLRPRPAEQFTVTGSQPVHRRKTSTLNSGRKIAREKTINKGLALLGYELRTKLAK